MRNRVPMKAQHIDPVVRAVQFEQHDLEPGSSFWISANKVMGDTLERRSMKER